MTHKKGANEMTTTENTIATTDAAEIAHTYHWFMHAVDHDNDAGICIYGDWLRSMQTRMGVQLMDPIAIDLLMRNAKKRFDASMTADA